MTTPELPPLPEPAGFRTRYRSEPEMIGHYPWTYAGAERRRRKYDRPECEYEDLFTADQMHAYALAYAAQCMEAGESRCLQMRATQPSNDRFHEGWNEACKAMAALFRSMAAQKGTA